MIHLMRRPLSTQASLSVGERITVIGLLGAGAAALWLSWWTWESGGYLPNLWLQLGSALFLFVPLYALERAFSTASNERLGALRDEVKRMRRQDVARTQHFDALQNFVAASSATSDPLAAMQLAIASIGGLVSTASGGPDGRLRVSVFEVWAEDAGELRTKRIAWWGAHVPKAQRDDQISEELIRSIASWPNEGRWVTRRASRDAALQSDGLSSAFLTYPIAAADAVRGFLVVEGPSDALTEKSDLAALALWTTLIAHQLEAISRP